MTQSIENEIINMMDAFFGKDIFLKSVGGFRESYPPMNQFVLEDNDKSKTLVIEMALSGKNKEDISLFLSENNKYLNVEVSKTKKENEDKKKYICRNIADRSIKLKIPLHFSTNQDLVESKYENGILTIELKEIKSETTKINIL